MKKGLFFLIFFKVTLLYAAIDLSDIASKERVECILSDFSNNPERYLPNYTNKPPETGMVKNNELEVDFNLNENQSAKIIYQSYKNSEDFVSLLKKDDISKVDDSMKHNLRQSLSEKYNDCQYCASKEFFQDNDFKQATTSLAVVSNASHQAPSSSNEYDNTIFQGKVHQCRKYGFGYLNCCNNNGWGQFVSQCNKEEIALRQAREKGTVVFLGTKKSGSKIKKKKHDVYCVFESKLARIIQEQGRFSQLYLSFGSAELPNCRGISANELTRIDLDGVDLSEIYPAIVNGISPIDERVLGKKMNQKITTAQESANANI